MRIIKKKVKPIKVLISPENPEPPEVLAKAILEISQGFKNFLEAGLNRRALILLVQDSYPFKVSRVDIGYVLDALPNLAKNFTLKKKAE